MINFDSTKYPKDHNWGLKKTLGKPEWLLLSIQYYVKCINCDLEIIHEERIKHSSDLHDDLFKINSCFYVNCKGSHFCNEMGKSYIPSYDKVPSCVEMIIKDIIE